MDTRTEKPRCPNCRTELVGLFCHACGQRRVEGRLSLAEFGTDIRKRVFRVDKDFAVTVGRALREPGALTHDYLEGRRKNIVDPLYYFFSSVFIQFLIATLVRFLASSLDQPSLGRWLGRLGGVVAIRIAVILWLGTVWRLLFRPKSHNLAEFYVFGIYLFGTVGLLWSALPLVDLAIPFGLADHGWVVVTTLFAIEWLYVVYAVRDFSHGSWWQCALRTTIVLGVGYGSIVVLFGPSNISEVLLPQ
jgi:hypothetical protein